MYLVWICSSLILLYSDLSSAGFWDDLGRGVSEIWDDVSSEVSESLDDLDEVISDVSDAIANGEPCWSLCDWAVWGQWSQCSRTCGGGRRTRRRGLCGWAWLSIEKKLKCCKKDREDQFQSEICGANCLHGTWNWYRESCNCQPHYRGTCCDTTIAHWSGWGAWSSCSQTCTRHQQSASKTRTRSCVKAKTRDRCRGLSTQSQHCTHLPTCPVTQWSEWLQWSECSTTCNTGNITGSRSRSRICIKVTEHGACPGYSKEEEQCLQLSTCPETTTVSKPTSTRNPVLFTVTPNNATSQIGETVVFECATQPEHQVFWYHNSFPVPENDPSGWYQVLPGGILIVSAVDTHHVGDYMCEVYTDQGSLQTSAWLTIPQLEEDTCQIEIVTIPHNVTVPEGSLAMLQCHSQNQAPVLWYKHIQSTNNHTDISNDNYDYYLSRLYDNLEDLHLQLESEMNETEEYKKGSYRVYLGGTGNPQVDDAERSRHITDHRELLGGVSVLRNGYLMLQSTGEPHAGTYTCEVQQDNCTLSHNATVTVYSNISQVCGIQVHNRSRWFNPDQMGHILGGSDATVGSAPWQVLMEESRVGFICGGVLISRYWMLTAAHCFSQFSKMYGRRLMHRNLVLKIGKHHRVITDPFAQERRMSQKIIHPLFNLRTYNNDIALVKFSSPVDFNDYVRPVCLPALEDSLYRESITAGKYGLVTGWGMTSEGGMAAGKLREVQVPIQPKPVCINSTSYQVTTSMFCAGDSAHTRDACKGDSGGPFVVPVRQVDGHPRWYLAGVVSWGIGCGRLGNYGFYTNITRAMTWIQNEIGDL